MFNSRTPRSARPHGRSSGKGSKPNANGTKSTNSRSGQTPNARCDRVPRLRAFRCAARQNAPNLRGERIASVNGYTVTYTGKRLTQVHADIVMGVFHLMRGRAEGDTVQFRTRSFLRLIGRSTGKTDRDSFQQLIDDIIATAIRITKPDGSIGYVGSILTSAKDKALTNDTLFEVKVERDLAKLFAAGFGKIDWAKRQSLMRKPLCQWLQLYFSSFGAKPVAVAELHRLSGSASPLKKFRQNLRKALAELDKHGVVRAVLEGDTDAVRRLAPDSRAKPVTPDAAQGMLPLGPPLSARAQAEFAARYPEKDIRQCIADMVACLDKKKRDGRKSRSRGPTGSF